MFAFSEIDYRALKRHSGDPHVFIQFAHTGRSFSQSAVIKMPVDKFALPAALLASGDANWTSCAFMAYDSGVKHTVEIAPQTVDEDDSNW